METKQEIKKAIAELKTKVGELNSELTKTQSKLIQKQIELFYATHGLNLYQPFKYKGKKIIRIIPVHDFCYSGVFLTKKGVESKTYITIFTYDDIEPI